jgi:hypothetical protein
LTTHETSGDVSGGGATVTGAGTRSGLADGRSGVIRQWLIETYEREWAQPVAKASPPPVKVSRARPSVAAVQAALAPKVTGPAPTKVARIAPVAKAPAQSVADKVAAVTRTTIANAQRAAAQDAQTLHALQYRQQQQRAAEAEEAEDEELLLLAVL